MAILFYFLRYVNKKLQRNSFSLKIRVNICSLGRYYATLCEYGNFNPHYLNIWNCFSYFSAFFIITVYYFTIFEKNVMNGYLNIVYLYIKQPLSNVGWNSFMSIQPYVSRTNLFIYIRMSLWLDQG